ncbi:FecR family protein [Geojedonia litorea]|uniref:FecR family protein n=1 Tax=Geojedonia litorea TaxID=1268269 RepID=A0ABV9N4F3_9FLAO
MDREDLLIKWLDGELNDAELALFKQLPEYASYEKLYKNAVYFKSPIVNKEKQFANFKSLLEKKDKVTSRQNFSLKFLMRIAAIFVVGLGLYFTILKEDLVKVNTSVAQQTNFTLPDNSEIIVNAESQIKYNESDWNKKRELKLNGEAFFKVAKGQKFDVKTELGTVTVLGTQFNVKQRGKLLEVQCFEGLVNVIIGKSNLELPAGNTIRLFENNLIRKKISLIKPTWIEGKSTFESVPYFEVIAELERQFDIEISLNNFDGRKIFTGSFVNDNIELALKSITQPFKLSYEINKDQISIFKNE